MMAGAKRKAAPDGDDTGRGRCKMHNNSISDVRDGIKGNMETGADIYEIRRAGAVICSGNIKNLGYPDHIL